MRDTAGAIASVRPIDDVVHERQSGASLPPRTNTPSASPHAADSAVEKRVPRKIRYTEAEWATLIERARACGRAPARYVREVSLGTVPRSSRLRANAPLIRDLGVVASTLRGVQERLAAGLDEPPGAPVSPPTEGAPPDVPARLDEAVRGLLDVIRRLG